VKKEIIFAVNLGINLREVKKDFINQTPFEFEYSLAGAIKMENWRLAESALNLKDAVNKILAKEIIEIINDGYMSYSNISIQK